MHKRVNIQGKKREKSSVLSLFLKVDREGAEVTQGARVADCSKSVQRLISLWNVINIPLPTQLKTAMPVIPSITIVIDSQHLHRLFRYNTSPATHR